MPYKFGRAALRTRLVNFVYRRMGLLEADPRDITRAIQADPVMRGVLDAVWPAVSPPRSSAICCRTASMLAACADEILDPDEQDAIRRTRSARWTVADLALVDEARDLLEGHTSTYGHVIVDEAQDLSPMQLRMIGRRAPGGSVTVLGDLAQATAAWTHPSWADVATHLLGQLATAVGPTADGPMADGWRSRDLTLGYRVPGLVLDFAAQLLPEAAPMVAATESVRVGRRPPAPARSRRRRPLLDGSRRSRRARGRGFLVGCIVADDHVAPATQRVRRRRGRVRHARA